MQGQALFLVQHPQRLHGRIVVVQRFAHAHQDDVEGFVEKVERLGEQPDLGGDLSRRQVPHEAHLAREAERATHRAAHLCRDAEGLCRRIGNEDGFNLLAVRQLQHELLRAVLRDVALGDGGERNSGLVDERRAQALAQVRHLGEVDDAAPPDPAVDLFGVETLVAERLDEGLEIAQLHSGEVGEHPISVAPAAAFGEGGLVGEPVAHGCQGAGD